MREHLATRLHVAAWPARYTNNQTSLRLRLPSDLHLPRRLKRRVIGRRARRRQWELEVTCCRVHEHCDLEALDHVGNRRCAVALSRLIHCSRTPITRPRACHLAKHAESTFQHSPSVCCSHTKRTHKEGWKECEGDSSRRMCKGGVSCTPESKRTNSGVVGACAYQLLTYRAYQLLTIMRLWVESSTYQRAWRAGIDKAKSAQDSRPSRHPTSCPARIKHLTRNTVPWRRGRTCHRTEQRPQVAKTIANRSDAARV